MGRRGLWARAKSLSTELKAGDNKAAQKVQTRKSMGDKVKFGRVTSLIAVGLLYGSLFLLAGCDSEKKPSYQELQAENVVLEQQLASVKGKIHDAQSELNTLKSRIDELSDAPCHVDSADDFTNHADSPGSAGVEARPAARPTRYTPHATTLSQTVIECHRLPGAVPVP